MIPNQVVLDDVFDLTTHGFSVIPIKNKEKYPILDSWKPYQTEKASKDKLTEWFADNDNNLAVVTGKVSNVVVLDVDNLQHIKEYELPNTPTVQTSRGFHYYFKHPGFDFESFKIPGLGDVQSDGKYVIAPPSIHPSGVQYKWIVGLDTPMAELPDWIIKKAKENSKPLSNDNIETTPYGLSWFKDVEELENEMKGGRNDLLNKVACKAGSLVEAGHLNRQEAINAMWNASIRNGSVSENRKEVSATIASGLKKGETNPRVVDARTAIQEDDGTELILRPMSSFKFKKKQWLWSPVLEHNSTGFISAEGGIGKSTVAADIAARITTGADWPTGNGKFEQGRVIYVTDENDPEEVFGPRLFACGADLDKVLFLELSRDKKGERNFNLERDAKALEKQLKALGDVRQVVVDPFNAYLGNKKLNDRGEMRGLLSPYMILARDYNINVLFIHHFNKTSENAKTRMSGSAALRDAARTSYHIERDPHNPDRRILVCDKINNGPDNNSIGFTIRTKEVDCEDGEKALTTYVEWDNVWGKQSSEEVFLAAQGKRPARDDAKGFLINLVRASQTNRIPLDTIKEEASRANINYQTLSSAAKELGITSIPSDNGDGREKDWLFPEELQIKEVA